MIKDHPLASKPRSALRLNDRALAKRNEQIAAGINVNRLMDKLKDLPHVDVNGVVQVDYSKGSHRRAAKAWLEDE